MRREREEKQTAEKAQPLVERPTVIPGTGRGLVLRLASPVLSRNRPSNEAKRNKKTKKEVKVT